jgi:putative ABC transport system substrate-binding protein
MALPARGPRIRRHASRIAGRSYDSPRRTGLPAVYAVCEDVDEGGLLSGANVADISRRAARYAGRILEGAKPADLPVEQATAVELVITMRTAKALGLTIPRRCCGKRSG